MLLIAGWRRGRSERFLDLLLIAGELLLELPSHQVVGKQAEKQDA